MGEFEPAIGDFQLQEMEKQLESDRARQKVDLRHQRTTYQHRREVIRRAAKLHAEGRFSKPTDAARFLMDDIQKGSDTYYTLKTICTWLWKAGWNRHGWPNRPDT